MSSLFSGRSVAGLSVVAGCLPRDTLRVVVWATSWTAFAIQPLPRVMQLCKPLSTMPALHTRAEDSAVSSPVQTFGCLGWSNRLIEWLTGLQLVPVSCCVVFVWISDQMFSVAEMMSVTGFCKLRYRVQYSVRRDTGIRQGDRPDNVSILSISKSPTAGGACACQLTLGVARSRRPSHVRVTSPRPPSSGPRDAGFPSQTMSLV